MHFSQIVWRNSTRVGVGRDQEFYCGKVFSACEMTLTESTRMCGVSQRLQMQRLSISVAMAVLCNTQRMGPRQASLYDESLAL